MSAPCRIRGITVWQPWASLLACGRKTVENRTWPPRGMQVGDYLAIHAGTKRDEESWGAVHAIREELGTKGQWAPLGLPYPMGFKSAPYGAIVGVAVLDEVRTAPRGDDPWWCGPVGWYVRDAVPIDPVPCKGAQGLWTLPGDVLLTVRERWNAARKAVPRG